MRLTWLLLLAACNRPSADPAPAPQTGAAPAALEAVAVVSKQLDTTVKLPAELSPDESVALSPRVQGFIDQIYVDRGSPVKKGQVLAQLAAPELAAQRAEAASQVTAARSTFERLKAASTTPGAIAGHDVEIAEATLQAALAKAEALRALEAYLSVRAPFDGVITERDAHPGALVGPPTGASSMPLLRIEKIDHLRVTVAVPEVATSTVAEGATATFTVSMWPGQKFTGKVSRIAHQIDPKTRTMAVELDVDNTGNKLVPGAYAEVDWPLRRTAPTLFVPPTAIVQTTERTYVDRVRDGKIEQVTIQRGATMGDVVEVFGELAAGDQVLKRGSEVLASGSTVRTTLAPAGSGSSPK